VRLGVPPVASGVAEVLLAPALTQASTGGGGGGSALVVGGGSALVVVGGGAAHEYSSVGATRAGERSTPRMHSSSRACTAVVATASLRASLRRTCTRKVLMCAMFCEGSCWLANSKRRLMQRCSHLLA
jgi:hypothetical protein